MLAVALVLLGLMALLAVLQYRWLGQVSAAERDRMRATLSTGATEFAQDFDRELTRAYLLFQVEPGPREELAARFAARYDQWHATARFPRLLREFYIFTPQEAEAPALARFDPATRRIEPAAWPERLTEVRARLESREIVPDDSGARALFITRLSQPAWERIPAIVAPLPTPLVLMSDEKRHTATGGAAPRLRSFFSHAILTIDEAYVRTELLPSLAARHFSRGGGALDFEVAVLRGAGEPALLYSSSAAFSPTMSGRYDASADLFQVRTQDFGGMVAEVRRFATFAAGVHVGAGPGPGDRAVRDVFTFHEARPLSIVVQEGAVEASPGAARSAATATRVTTVASSPRWRLVLRHPDGSLEAAVGKLRRRNLLVSTSVLGVLGASMGLLVLSTRRAQRLARQQMEFVAAVSHELRTPLAVIRSAAENLADGVVGGDDQIRKYGELMRSEGRRLTEMVEQILELAGIHSGQRGFVLRSVPLEPLIADLLESSASLIRDANLEMDVSLPPDLPPVLGDEAALRRALGNLIGNAIKYGASGGWVGIAATRSGSEVSITIADRGIGIAPADQPRVFEPFYRAPGAVEAQIQGAGLGLSLVQRIVEAHGGRVRVKSAPGEGAAFTMHLPAAGEDAVPRREAGTAPVPPSTGTAADGSLPAGPALTR